MEFGISTIWRIGMAIAILAVGVFAWSQGGNDGVFIWLGGLLLVWFGVRAVNRFSGGALLGDDTADEELWTEE